MLHLIPHILNSTLTAIRSEVADQLPIRQEAKGRGTRLFEQAFRSHTKIPTSKGGDAVREREVNGETSFGVPPVRAFFCASATELLSRESPEK